MHRALQSKQVSKRREDLSAHLKWSGMQNSTLPRFCSLAMDDSPQNTS